jgi:PilZ domain
MEHRYSSRVPTDIKMLIYRRGVPVATGRIRNASRVGVFVETDYPELRRYQPLECEFRLVGEMPPTRHRFSAHVSRQANVGVGLEVDDEDSRTRAEMECLLQWTAPANRHPESNRMAAIA